MQKDGKQTLHSTTVLGLIKDGKAVIGSDGQVTFGNTI
jgi:ATP-dependent protease HslVU (ClpYQ), peptidase subunit